MRYRPRPAAFVAFVLLAMLASLLWAIFGPAGMPEVAELSDKLDAQRAANAQLVRDNRQMATTVNQLAEDPAQLEAQSRYSFGLIKPGEVFVQIADKASSE